MTDAPPTEDAPRPPPREAPGAAERAISPVAGRLGSGLAGKGVVFAALVAACGVFVVATWGDNKPKPERAPVQPARQVVPFDRGEEILDHRRDVRLVGRLAGAFLRCRLRARTRRQQGAGDGCEQC